MLELNKLYCMDCQDGMKQFPDKYFDLAIVDPPYGIGNFAKVGDANYYKKRSDKKYGKIDWNNKIPDAEYFDELYRISKNQIIWGANYFRKYIKDTGVIVWDKDNANSRWSKVEIASNSTSGINDIFKFTWDGFRRSEKVIRIHPTQKPIVLYKWILRKYAKPNMKIIDTHVGSGSSIIAFIDFGCDWIGFEIDRDYFDSATKRIENHKLQLKLNFVS